jgi:hypothetical protein
VAVVDDDGAWIGDAAFDDDARNGELNATAIAAMTTSTLATRILGIRRVVVGAGSRSAMSCSQRSEALPARIWFSIRQR